MADKKGDGDKNKTEKTTSKDNAENAKEKLKELYACDKVLSEDIINHALAETVEKVEDIDENTSSSDEVDEDLEDEYHRLNEILDLPEDTYSLTKINLDLPPCVKYGIRSGLTHLNMSKFSPLSRGLQGPAIAIAAYATTSVVKARCWNEFVIDQIVEDGDTYYCESYKNIDTNDRRTLTILDLKRELTLQNTHYVHLNIDDPAYAGTFRSQNPTEMHLVKALELFFRKYDAGVLTSSKLNLAIWKDAKYFNIFDGQARGNNCEPVMNGQEGAAKLILVRNLTGVVFIILEKSNVTNEPFVLFGIAIASTYKIPLINDDPEEPEKSIGKPRRRPSGYKIQAKFRALVQGSYHLMHSVIPKELQGRGHLVIALAALIYSRLVKANKWTSAMIDLIFNQAHIYMVDLVRVLGKKLNETLELKIDDLMGDVVLGVYAAKVQVEVNVVPGQGKKGKATIDAGIRDFFKGNISGILEIKKIFYAIWKDGNKYYLLDPFACDHEGFRVDPNDSEDARKYETAVACVTMNSSINEIIETILENTGCKEKDPFVVHGIRILYVKTGSVTDGPLDRVIYREKNTNRRPQPLPIDIPRKSVDETECKTVLDMIPKPRFASDKIKDKETQFPEFLHNVEQYMMKEDEPTSFIEGQSEHLNKIAIASLSEKEVKYIKGYNIVNPHRLLLQGWKNCFSEEFDERSRGKQGLIIALTAIAYGKVKHPSAWRNIDVNQIIDVGHKTYEDTIMWIRQGRPEEKKDTEEHEEGSNEDETNEDRKKDKGEDGDKGDYEEDIPTGTINIGGNLQSAPSHLDLSMLPDKIKLGENEVIFKKKMGIVEGNADPLVNLGEALEFYFTYHDELLVENKRLIYGVWKTDGKFFLFNPYGSDEEGQRIRGYPASFAITSSVNELIDLFYMILEYNESRFSFHFIGIESIQPNNKYLSPNPIRIPEDDLVNKYETIFLPVTDEDLWSLTQKLEPETLAPLQDVQHKLSKGGADEEQEEKEVDEAGEKKEEEGKELEDEETEEEKVEQSLESEKPLTDPLLEVQEGEQPDAPERLNLSLLTGNVNFEEENEEVDEELMEALTYEKLKYKHPPPYVRPPKKIICTLLEAKRASKSIHSLISRFSIDSKLAIKQRSDLPSTQRAQESTIATVNISDGERPSKLIKLSSRKYVISRIPRNGLMPLRAINDKFIQDENLDRVMEEECERRKHEKPVEDVQWEEVPNVPTEIRINPTIIPLGPTIKTLTPKIKLKSCLTSEIRKRKCRLLEKHREDAVLEKLVCKTEDVLFNMMFPNSEANVKEIRPFEKEKDLQIEDKKKVIAGVRMKDSNKKPKEPPVPEHCGFKETDENISVLEGNMCLENRLHNEACHFKQCYFTAILCILGKVQMNVKYFRGSILDQFIVAGDKMYQYTGKLRYKPLRWFYNVIILGTKYNVMLKQVAYADPDSWKEDDLLTVLTAYLTKYQTGILVFSNISYAFWYSNDKYYLFDAYACDDKGHANESGFACLMQFADLSTMLKRIQENTGEQSAGKPYRIYALAVVHMESLKCKTKKQKEVYFEEEPEEDHYEPLEPGPALSLIELAEWVVEKKRDKTAFDMTIPGFAAIPNFIASSLEVIVLENNVTTPILTEFKSIRSKQQDKNAGGSLNETLRKKQRNRTFKEYTANISEPIDLCIMAWAHIHDPTQWGIRTVKGIFEASKDFTFDCLLAFEDTTLDKMTDGVLPEFTVANYTFRAVFAPLHHGTLYATVGWNLAMSLKKVFNTPIYSGAILICGKAHIGTMKKNKNYYAWWTVPRTKNLKIITSEEIEDLLKLIVMEIDEPYETEFLMRVVTISYAQKMDPDCDDTAGLHEKMVPTTSLPEIHRKRAQPYDIEAIFRKTIPSPKPIFVQGSVALSNCDVSKEPKVKRCYFVAILAVMVKRDIMQSTVPGMIDKIIEVAEGLYKEFKEPMYHTEHILRNVTVMNRVFEFRDCASPFVAFEGNPTTGKNNRFLPMKKCLKRHFKKHTDGIIHFTNCCYGFWYSRSTNSYYYLNPYQCDAKGRAVLTSGKSCLCIFSCMCHMVKHMCQNQSEDTTGFFIHQLHVESINVPPFKKFQEDPMWVYLDFHWSFSHAENNTKAQKKKRQTASKQEKPSWNNYAIEVPNLIYSVWGTIGCYDSRFGDRAGRNQAAICVAILAMQYLCHPSQWSPAILDSAVICGDCYYTESLKSAVRKGCRHQNRFNLQSRFKVFPHVWTVEFKTNMCGTLYGDKDGMTLATIIKIAFEEAPNVIIECNGATFSALAVEDGYYVADPRWTGLPLFSKNHGALYVLRCRNTNALIYALTKMLNTNQRLGFHITPIVLTFTQELCKLDGEQMTVPHKRILVDPVGTRPGRSNGPDVPVPLSSPDEDSYPWYCRNLAMGMKYGEQLENPTISSFEPKLRDVNLNNVKLSTTWHLNIGHSVPHKRTKGTVGPSLVTFDDTNFEKMSNKMNEPLRLSTISSCLEEHGYPRTIDFVEDVHRASLTGPSGVSNTLFGSGKVPGAIAVKPIHCAAVRNFFSDRSEGEFLRQAEEMADKNFTLYQHRVPLEHGKDETDPIVVDEIGNTDASENEEPPVAEEEAS